MYYGTYSTIVVHALNIDIDLRLVQVKAEPGEVTVLSDEEVPGCQRQVEGEEVAWESHLN